jgi:hypothetical protein
MAHLCNGCGAALSEDSKFCGVCGMAVPVPIVKTVPFVPKFCNECGSPVKAGANYCEKCRIAVNPIYDTSSNKWKGPSDTLVIASSLVALLLAWYLGQHPLTMPLLVLGQIGLWIGTFRTRNKIYVNILIAVCSFALLYIYANTHERQDQPFFVVLWLSALVYLHFSIRHKRTLSGSTARAWPWTLAIILIVGVHQVAKLQGEYDDCLHQYGVADGGFVLWPSDSHARGIPPMCSAAVIGNATH